MSGKRLGVPAAVMKFCGACSSVIPELGCYIASGIQMVLVCSGCASLKPASGWCSVALLNRMQFTPSFEGKDMAGSGPSHMITLGFLPHGVQKLAGCPYPPGWFDGHSAPNFWPAVGSVTGLGHLMGSVKLCASIFCLPKSGHGGRKVCMQVPGSQLWEKPI